MKKVIFWILSLLLISPAFATNYNLWQYYNIFTSFENLESSNNITYWLYLRGLQWYITNSNISSSSYKSPLYFDSNWIVQHNINFYESESTQYWTTYSDSNWFNAFSISWSDIFIQDVGTTFLWYWLFSIWKNWFLLNPSVFNFYFQRTSNATSSAWNNNLKNYTLNFWNYLSSWNWELISNNSYLRFFYNWSTWFSSWYFPWINNWSAVSVQYFTKNNTLFKTEKWQAWIWVTIDKVSPSVSNWFSFISTISDSSLWSIYYDDLNLFSVFPLWDSSWGSSLLYSIPNWYYTDKFYIFRLNSNKYNSDINDIWVISKCNQELCSWFALDEYLSSLIYSEYICSWSSNYNFKNDCVLVYWWILYNVLWSITWYNSVITWWSNNFVKFLFSSNSLNSNFWSPSVPIWFSSDISNSTLSISDFNLSYRNSTTSNVWLNTASYNITLTWWYSNSNFPNILWSFNFNQGWGQWWGWWFINSWDVYSWSVSKCVNDTNYYYTNTTLCNSLWVFIWDDWLPVRNTSLSWASCLRLVKMYDENWNLVEKMITCDDAQSYLSWWFYEDSNWNIFYQCFWDSCLYSNTSSYFESWIVTSSYYNSDSIFFSCPYPIVTWWNSLLTRLSNVELWQFSIWLPIVCFYSAFVHWKNYRFLSDVNLWLNPLMWEIQSINDPRNYLYWFFDFLLSFAVFIFLLKLYHLIK